MVLKNGSIKDFAKDFLHNIQRKNAEQGITLHEMGKTTTQSFSQNPARLMRAMNSLEN